MKKASRSILEYIGTLDSTRTSHYLGLQENDERWWIPANEVAWKEQMHIASATTLARILRGDVLCLPRNQFFDSPGWLNLASYLARMKLPTFSICLDKELSPHPQNYISEITNIILRNQKFALSGWPGLSIEERNKIADNIQKDQNFSRMFEGVTLDNSVEDFLKEQRDALQFVLEYIDQKKWWEYRVRRSTGYKTPPWDRLTRDVHSKKFRRELFQKHEESIAREYIEHLDNLVKEMPLMAKADVIREYGDTLSKGDLSIKVNQWLNQRTNFYRAISHYPDSVRQLLREHINDSYDDSLTESVTDTGRQVSADNGNKGVPYITRSKHMDILKERSSEKFVAIPYHSSIDNDTLASLVEVLNDETIQKSIENMRSIRLNADISDEQIDEAENQHLELLTKYIPYLIVERSAKSWIIDFSFTASGTAVKVIGWAGISGAELALSSYLISNRQIIELLISLGIMEASKAAIPSIVNSVNEKLKPSKERIMAWFNRKDSNIIAGRISEWLKSAWKDEED